jgi:hypothetical protein
VGPGAALSSNKHSISLVIKKVYPNTTLILCSWHIFKNIEKNCLAFQQQREMGNISISIEAIEAVANFEGVQEELCRDLQIVECRHRHLLDHSSPST